jgi:hypothetical protein
MSSASPDMSRSASRRVLDEWRRRRLILAGFDETAAAELARDDTVDLHELLLLLDRGCPPSLAAQILAPLDAPLGPS